MTPWQPRESGMAITSLVLGMLWLFWIGSIVALVLGLIALRTIQRSNGCIRGWELATAGIVLGSIGVAWLGLTLAFLPESLYWMLGTFFPSP